MYHQTPSVRLDSTTNDMYGRYQHNHYIQRLPKPQRILKNRFLDQSRSRIRRSNDEYGQFWDSADLGTSGRNFAAGLTSEESNRHTMLLSRALTNRKGAESASFWNEPQDIDDFGSRFRSPSPIDKRINTQERNYFKFEPLLPLTSHSEQVDRDSTLFKESTALPPIPRGAQNTTAATATATATSTRPNSRSGGDVDDLDKFIEQYKVHVGIANKGQNSIRVPAIRYIDLELHLQDNSSVTIKAVPFSFR